MASNKTYVFDRLLLRGIREGKMPARNKEAREWFRNKAKKVSDSRNRFFTEAGKARRKKKVEVGRMYFFKYSAKWKEELPFWDAVPVIFPFWEEGKYFMGINLHYLPPKLRAKLMDALYGLTTDRNFDKNTKLRISYGILKEASRYKEYKPCVKKYLKSQVQSDFIEVEASEWDIAIFLPLQQFRGAGPQKVYADSRKIIAGKKIKR